LNPHHSGDVTRATPKISDEAHAKLTSVVGRLMAETGKMKTYSDAIEAILSKSVVLSPEVLDHVENLIKGNSQLGCTTEKSSYKTQYALN
jgi:hypothetical protein